MHLHTCKPLLVLLALGCFTGATTAAPKSHIKERGTIEMEVALEATVDAPAGVAASALITIHKPKFHRPATATLTLTTSGFPAGEYSIDALIKGGTTPVHVGDFAVAAVVPVDPAADEPITLTIPTTVDATLITNLTISDSSSIVLLEGDAVETSVNWGYLANVRVTAGELPLVRSASSVRKWKRTFGHVISQSVVRDGVEKKRHFLWVAFGAPAETELTINVDGVAVGTVTSTKRGKVMFHEMPEPVVLRDVQLITLTDGLGAVVMKAEF
jgi:hypothetical protein